ncbi:MAG: hypothetical protein OQK82_02785 [Candidatus Pacearchaeota archaeon]|nr:hypothetical protein [Candidatus Pacearchaeota archaeon]
MITLIYKKFNTFEVIDGGDGMIMVEGVIVNTLAQADVVCEAIEAKKLRTLRSEQNEIWYCCLAA